MMDFGQALHALRNGRRVCRAGWNGKGMWLALANNGTAEFHTNDNAVSVVRLVPLVPFISMKTADDKFVPWLASQTDILATDWEAVVEPTGGASHA